jgi:hypothetical protein
VDEGDLLRLSEKANGDDGYCNMSQERMTTEDGAGGAGGRLADNRRRLAPEEREAWWCICSDGDLLRV